MSIIGFEARNETSFREGDSHTLRQIVQLVLPAVQTFVCEGDWPMVNFASRRSISFTAKDCRPNYFMLCKTFLCGAWRPALHLPSIRERGLFFATLASFTREWFQKYRQKQLDGSKNSLLSIVSSQLIVILLFWLSHFRVPFDEKVTKPSQLTQDESMDSAALAETKISSNSSKSKTIDCE